MTAHKGGTVPTVQMRKLRLNEVQVTLPKHLLTALPGSDLTSKFLPLTTIAHHLSVQTQLSG